jgi:hypothetical protein
MILAPRDGAIFLEVFLNNPSADTKNVWASRVARIDSNEHVFLRYGLVVTIVWIAGMKAGI